MSRLSYACAVCSEGLTEADPQFIKLTATKPDRVEVQQFYVHGSCLASKLDSAIPLGELFGD